MNGIFSICSCSQTKTMCATEATPHHDAIIEPAQKVELITKEQPTRDVGPIINEEPILNMETTEADEKVSRFEIVVPFHSNGSAIASLTHCMLNSVLKKSIDVDDCSSQMFEIDENKEGSSLPPWWSWEFMCGDFSICSCSQDTTHATDATPNYEYEELSFIDDDTTLTSYTRASASAARENGQ
jgi:hypothetical protein